MQRAQRLIYAAAALWFFATSSGAATEAEAVAVVDGLQSALIDAATLDLDDSIDALDGVVRAAHDLATMGRRTVNRRYWRAWSEAEQDRFIAAFARLSVTSYASRFANVTPETFEILGGALNADGRAEVQTVVHRADGSDDVSLDYLLQLVDGDWRIVNVFADGVSELSLMASEYFSILESGSLDDLVLELEAQVAELLASESP